MDLENFKTLKFLTSRKIHELSLQHNYDLALRREQKVLEWMDPVSFHIRNPARKTGTGLSQSHLRVVFQV